MIKKYVKKPIPIEAVEWNGLNTNEILDFSKDAFFEYYTGAYDAGAGPVVATLYIKTLEGNMKARVGDYIIKGVRGEFYPCEKTIFEETYDEYNLS